MSLALAFPSSVRRVTSFLPALIAGLFAALSVVAQPVSVNDGFNPDVDGTVFTVVAQSDGKLLVGGQFTSVSGVSRSNLARINADGSVDTTFNPSPNAPVRAILVQRDNRVVIGGDFTAVQPGASGTAVTRNRLARINADGSVDTTFNPNLGGQLQPQVHALLLQADNRIVAGGSFTTVQPNGAAAATTRNYLARFNTDGTLDTAFNPNPNAMVLALALHVDNKIIVGGGFTTLQAPGETAPSTRNRVARLNPSGTVDSEFNPNANNGVTSIAVQRDGKILLAGYFTTVQPPTDVNPAGRSRLARLNVDGTLDSEFYPRADGAVATVSVQADGLIVVGGAFTAVWGQGATSVNRGFIARFKPDGSLDSGFAPTLNGAVNAVAQQADGKLVIGGSFTRATPQGASSAVIRNRLARLSTDGSLDSNFELDAGGRILVSVTQADGKILVGGSFTSIAGLTRNYVARLNADGTIDTTYAPNFNGRVYAMVLQPDGKVLVGGAFTEIGGETRRHLARLNPSGTIDSEFYPHFDGQVGTLVLQSDGKILVGGTFNTVTPGKSTTPETRANLVRLNADGTIDSAFDPNPNSTVAAIVVQSDGKIIIGGLFSALRPGAFASTSASFVTRNFLARINAADGKLDDNFKPTLNGQVSTLQLQSDGKLIVGGAFTTVAGSDGKLDKSTDAEGKSIDIVPVRNRLARLTTEGNLDPAYNPNANGNVITSVLQPDGRLLIGGSFTTLQPNGASDWTLRKYAARLNTDGSVDASFNLDLSEQAGNRVDSLRLQSDGRLLIGGAFTSLQPIGATGRVTRRNFARLLSSGQVDTAFDAAAGGSTGAIVNALAVQPDGRVIAAGSFSDLGGAKSTNIARFRPEGTPDPDFSPVLTTDGPVNALVVRTAGAPVPTQLGGFAWLNANGTLRSGFAAAGARLSGEIVSVAIDREGRLLVGGSFANLNNSSGGNLARFKADGTLDAAFTPAPNGAVTGIVVQPDGRIVVVGSFTTVAGTARNRMARIDDNGSLDVTFDPSSNGRITSVVRQSDGKFIVGGDFTGFTPNLTTTNVARNYLARVNEDGTIDANYNPSPSAGVSGLAQQADGKVIVVGGFNSLTPNGATTPVTRNYVARLNTDGTLDQNFDPNAGAPVNAVAALTNGQFLLGGSFTTLQPSAGGGLVFRNNLARINSDGAVDQTFNPNPNGPVTTLAVQSDGFVLLGGAFTTLQPGGAGVPVTRNRLARVDTGGAIDLNFNPDIRGTIGVVAARPDGSVLVGGNFTDLQLNGSIVVGGNFASIGGVTARNLAMLNDNGSVTTSFQPRPDGAVNALLALPDGRTLVGGAFTTINGVTRQRLARFNADGTFDSSHNASAPATVRSLALQADGRVLVGHANGILRLTAAGAADASFNSSVSGAVTALAVQGDGRILYAVNQAGVARLNADGSADNSFSAPAGSAVALALQADGKVLVAGTPSRLVRLNANGSVDAAFAPAPNGSVTALALQADGRLMIGGGFGAVGGISRPGIARLSSPASGGQALGVAANRGSVLLNRTGAIGEISSVTFEISSNLSAWTRLGDGVRAPGTANWQVAGVSLPATSVFYIRARAVTPTVSGIASGLYEVIREFNYASPVPGLGIPATSTSTPAQAAAQPGIDVATGIIPRAISTAVPGEGTVSINLADSTRAADSKSARLVNLSTRGEVSPGNPLILGFAIAGTEPRPVLVRGAGPALGGFGVSGALTATSLQIYSSGGTLLADTEGWGREAGAAAAQTGAFPFTTGSADSAALVTLSPGVYTVQVGGSSAGTSTSARSGVALVEIYDAGSGDGARLVNVSSRGPAASGNGALISGFVLEGGAGARVLLRGVGPAMAQFGATNTVADPSIALYDRAGQLLGGNDNWVSSLPDIATAALRAGAFALPAGSKDAAVLATLPAGVYTIQIGADSASSGSALLEIYEVP
jgi:uncharacterized delta-60 repeat protein